MSLVSNYNDLFMKCFELILSKLIVLDMHWKNGVLHIFLLQIEHNLVWLLSVNNFNNERPYCPKQLYAKQQILIVILQLKENKFILRVLL